MEHEYFVIEIEGREVSDIYHDLIRLEVELDNELAGMFRLYIAMAQLRDGTWTHLDDERLTAWKRVDIKAGFESGTEEIMYGYITHVKPDFDPDPSQCTLKIWGMDKSVLMDQQEQLKDWPNKKDSDIAREIFDSYGLTHSKDTVDDTLVIHEEVVSTIIQRETDMQFLRRLALRNGFECYVEGTTGYFKKPRLHGPSQPVLAVHFGEETNVNHLSLELDVLKPSNVVMSQIDRTKKSILKTTAQASQQTALGSSNSVDLLPIGINPGRIHVGMNAATGNPEMTELCQELFHQSEWFVSGEGEINGNHYGHVLKPRQTVTLKGVGETYSGLYYVTHVTHSFTSDGYIQLFRVIRNAVMPTGSEDFSATSESSI